MSQTEEKVEIIGANVFGQTRKFTFRLMDAETGLEVFHNTVSGLVDLTTDIVCLIPALKKVSAEYGDGKASAAIEAGNASAELVQVVQVIPKILTLEKIKYLAKSMLAGCSVEFDGATEEIGDSGIPNYAARDPLELYAAIVFAVGANYPKYISSLAGVREMGNPEKSASTPPPSQSVKMKGPAPR